MAIGEGVGAGAGAVIGGLVAGGAIAATDTYPLAGATVPAGVVGGTAIGTVEALPLTFLGSLVDSTITYATCQ